MLERTLRSITVERDLSRVSPVELEVMDQRTERLAMVTRHTQL